MVIMERDTSRICLFDVDGTLTPSRNKMSEEMSDVLSQLKERLIVGVVSGSDLVKIAEQLSTSGPDGEVPITSRFDYVFTENGLVAHKGGDLLSKTNIVGHVGEEKLQKFINFVLKKFSELELPCKRGTFVEFRNGMINVCPVGRSCTQEERNEFAAYDQEHNIRKNLVKDFKKEFPDAGLSFVIGGQISIDVFPEGWDKRFCLKHLEGGRFKEIHFFGDKTTPGGNDYELFADDRTIGHSVTSPEDTIQQLKELFLK